MEWGRQMGFINHFYFYLWDPDWGGAFWKTPGRGPPGDGDADLQPADHQQTPGTFRTKVITKGIDPQVSCYCKSSRIKQYFKEHRALRTETVICNTRDSGIGRRVTAENWKALRAVGEAANQRLCDA